jgi:hypothetical protein
LKNEADTSIPLKNNDSHTTTLFARSKAIKILFRMNLVTNKHAGPELADEARGQR